EKNKIDLLPSAEAISCRNKLAIQVGSGKSRKEVGCSFHVTPRSDDTLTARPLSGPQLSLFLFARMLSMSSPLGSATTVHSVVPPSTSIAFADDFHVRPPSVL